MRPSIALLLCVVLTHACGRSPAVSLDPDEFIATAHLPDNLKIELAAREPNVVDPVAIAFDADGKMYVVEMRDYPVQPEGATEPLGRVKLLEDLDLDGYYETATVFAAGLQFPTSVLPWDGGVLVTQPPDILFLKDTSGDGIADVREALFTGFPVGNTQHNINGLIWGLDNWVYGANGGNHGSAHAVAAPDKEVSIRGMDFRFRPDTAELQVSYETTGGYGIAVDAWGHMFGTHNLNHIQHMVVRAEYLTRNPDLIVRTTRDQISDHESSAKLYQISEPETRVNHPEQAGHVSGASGITYYGGGALPSEYEGSVFVNDVVVNVVHQDVVKPDGPSFTASRSRDEEEFLAGRDNWFRPVALAVGPDGALYVVDMHRAVIEHPEWIPDQVEKTLDLRAGDDKGRIYRIVPRDGLDPVRPQLAEADLETLVTSLEHSNKWWRDTAQRLLVERQDPGAIPLLTRMVRESGSALGRLHALWSLDGLEALSPELLATALGDPSPGVRENALRMAEGHEPESSELRGAILTLAGDPDARVRLQLALTAGGIGDPRANQVLLGILRQDVQYQWSRDAVLSTMRGSAVDALVALLAPGDPFSRDATEGGRDLVRRLASLVGTRHEPREVGALIRLAGRPRLLAAWQTAVLDGLADGLDRGGFAAAADAEMRNVLDRLLSGRSTSSVRAALRVASGLGIENAAAQDRALAQARARVLDASRPLDERVHNIELLALGSYRQVGASLLSLMDVRQPLELQVAAARALAQLDDEATGREVLARWRRYSPQVKVVALNMLLRRVGFHELLISALENGDLTFGELNLDLEQRRRLLRHSTDDIKARAAALFGDHEFSNRSEIVERYAAEVVPLRGDAARGESHYRDLCAQCHVLRGEGDNVGPDLEMAFSKGKEDLLTSILDPNTAIHPEYTNVLIETTEGELLTGLILAETLSSITLVRGHAETDTVLRSEIRQMRTDGLSLMPEGLEEGLDYQDLADLLAFMQQHRH